VSELFGPKTLLNSAQRTRATLWRVKWWTADVHSFQILATRYFADDATAAVVIYYSYRICTMRKRLFHLCLLWRWMTDVI